MPAPSDPEIKICGAHACHAVAERRPEDVRRVYITEAMMPNFGGFLRWCASQRLAYHVVEEQELERLMNSVHHGGVAFIVRQPPPPTLGALLHRLRSDERTTPRLLLYLDNVQNPHNLGAIVRVAAHFGADGVLIAGEGRGMSTAMTRTAEGGAEFIDVIPVALGQRPLITLRNAGFTLAATTSHGRDSLYGGGLPPRTVIMLGSESHGLAPSVAGLADLTITIPGTGSVESLNVACAAAVLLAEHWRRHHEPPGPEGPRENATGKPKRPPTSAESSPGPRDRESGRPGEPDKSRGSGKPGESGESGESDRPKKTKKPKKTKTQHDKHGRPVQHGKPGKPSKTGKHGKPSSGKHSKPSSGKHSKPGKPGKPSKSSSGKHGTLSGKAGKPGKSSSGKSGKSGKAGKPGKHGTPGKSSSGKAGNPGKPGKPGKSSRPGKSKPGKSGKPGDSGEPGKH